MRGKSFRYRTRGVRQITLQWLGVSHRLFHLFQTWRAETEGNQIKICSLVIKHICRAGVRLAEILGNVALLDGVYGVIIEHQPGIHSLDNANIVSMIWAASDMYDDGK